MIADGYDDDVSIDDDYCVTCDDVHDAAEAVVGPSGCSLQPVRLKLIVAFCARCHLLPRQCIR